LRRETMPQRDELLLPKGCPGRALRQFVSRPIRHPPTPETNRPVDRPRPALESVPEQYLVLVACRHEK
jgi:hypothetical protein